MKYEIKKPTMSGIEIRQPKIDKGETTPIAIVHYTIEGKGIHNGTGLNINEGISVEVPIPSELVSLADSKAQEYINNTYKNDPE